MASYFSLTFTDDHCSKKDRISLHKHKNKNKEEKEKNKIRKKKVFLRYDKKE